MSDTPREVSRITRHHGMILSLARDNRTGRRMAATIKVSGDTHERLLQLTLSQSARCGVRLTMESVLTGLLDLADAHPDEVRPVTASREDGPK